MSRLFLVITSLTSACLSVEALAHSAELDTVVISSAGQNSIYDVAQPATVLNKDAINGNPGDTLGTLLDSTPGIANASFGPGVGRPVIRGMSGSRVKILQNGSDSADLSAMSSDHSPMAEASSAEQIEVIYGPATLMYGGGAIGGVVNLIDRRIHEQPGSDLSGGLNIKGSSNDSGYSTDGLMDTSRGNWTLHLDGFQRSAADYHSGERGDIPAANNSGRITNSDSEGSGGAAALSWADGKRGFIGGSISTLEYDYGVPNTDGEPFRVKPKQVRYDLKGAWRPDPSGAFSWLDEWRTELSFNDYEHAETGARNDIPGAATVDIGLFDQESWELQSRMRHAAFGQWQGTFGLQMKYQKLALCHNHSGCSGIPSFAATAWDGETGFNLLNRERGGFLHSHSTPMPLNETTQTGVFLVEQRDWSQGTLELGARLDSVSISSDPDPIDPNYRQQRSYYNDKNFNPATLSAAGTWVLDEQQRLGLNLARVQRAPDAAELFWNGDHHATFSFQLDNPDLSVETAWTVDINWLRESEHDRIKIALFHYRFQDYIYNELKDFTDPFHDNNVYRQEQDDARFLGAEFSWQHNIDDLWHLDINADVVQARLRNGDHLPRTPPASALFAINRESGHLLMRLEGQATASQKRTAANEDPSDGYTLLNASLSYRQLFAHSELLWRLAASNLIDQYAVNHVSYLKHAAPLAGRNIQLGLNWSF